MLMSRFYFLEEKHPEIYTLCTEAEQAKLSDSSVSLLKARQALEKIIACVNPENKGEEDLFTQISELSDLGIVTEDELAAFHTVRRTANRAVHGEQVSATECAGAIDSLFKITGWLTFYVGHQPFDNSAISNDDQKLILSYIKSSVQEQNKVHYDLLNQGIDPLALDIPFDVEEEPVDVLAKDVFETDEEYAQRIENMPPVHLGYCMLDKSKADAFTHIIFPIYHLDKNDKIISQPVDAFFIVDNENTPSIVDGEIVAKLKVFKYKVYFDYYKVQINLDNGVQIPLETISWQAYEYDNVEDTAKRVEALPILPIGMCRYRKQEYRITDGYLPANIWIYKYIQGIYQKQKAIFYVERDLAKQLCSTTHLSPIYARIDSKLKIQQVLAYEQQKQVILLENMPLHQDTQRLTALSSLGFFDAKIQLAEKGTASDKYCLGMDYLKGNGVEKNEEEAYKWIYRAYKDGDMDAAYVISQLYSTGIGINEDVSAAFKILVEAASRGSSEALEKLKTKGTDGDVNAQYELGKMYYKYKKNTQEAVKWFRLAAKQNHKESQEFLESGVIPTVEALVKRVRQRDTDAMYQLGMAFYNGTHYVQQDKREAWRWLNLALNKGNIKAAATFIDLYNQNLGYKSYLEKAIEILQVAIKSNDKVAESMMLELSIKYPELKLKYYLGKTLITPYSEGRYEKGIQYIMDAVKQGVPEAICEAERLAETGDYLIPYLLGQIYLMGTVKIKQNFEKGFELMRKAAELGYDEAQYQLGCLYYSGKGIPKNFNEGIKWLRCATNQGHDKAIKLLNELEQVLDSHRQEINKVSKSDIEGAQKKSVILKVPPEIQKIIGTVSIYDISTMYQVGLIYYWGQNGVAQNKKNSYRWFKEAMNGGHVNAACRVAELCFLQKYGSADDLKSAVHIIQEWAKNGNKEAEQTLELLKAIEEESKAIIELEQKADNNDGSAMLQLGLLYYNGCRGGIGVDKNKAFEWLKKAVICGYISIVDLLTSFLQYGDIGENWEFIKKWGNIDICRDGYKDIEKLREFISKREYTDNIKGKEAIKDLKQLLNKKEYENKQQALKMFELGTEYLNNKEHKTAAKWYRKAAELGLANAQYMLGICYFRGYGVDKYEAVRWCRKAVAQGNSDAQNLLGCFYRDGIDVPQDSTEAVRWFRKAAIQGQKEAQYNLGLAYYHGRGVAKDNEKVKEWFQKAAAQGVGDAQNMLGCFYRDGEVLPKDNTEAVKWFRKAAEQGMKDAQYNLGLAYYHGQGVAQDKEKAKEWLQIAASQGHEGAKKKLENMRSWFSKVFG